MNDLSGKEKHAEEWTPTLIDRVREKPITLAQVGQVLLPLALPALQAAREEAQRSLKPQLVRVEIPLQRVNPLSWLLAQPGSEKLYWRDRLNTLEVAGVGTAFRLQGSRMPDYERLLASMRTLLHTCHAEARFFGGFSFHPDAPREALWKNFGAYRFWLPELECGRRDEAYYLAFQLVVKAESKLPDLVRQIEALAEQATLCWEFPWLPPLPEYGQREDLPAYPQWEQLVKDACHRCQEHSLEKIVLARRTRFQLSKPVSPTVLFAHLARANPDAFQFLWQVGEAEAFLGCSPERLYLRRGRLILTEAVAGTRPRGATGQEDRRLARELLHSKKDRWEHYLVVKSIHQALEQLCEKIESQGKPTVLALARVQHLANRFEGILNSRTGDARILQALHPTPAVGGYPTDRALQVLPMLEPFVRGWYAAPVGWVGKEGAEFAVAIRSGLLRERELFLFSGAGIVLHSHPRAEWEEIENKMNNFLRIFQRPA